jgi:hypothetical protein
MSEKKDLSRSDLVRQRRERDSRTRVERARKESTRTVPITSRRQETPQSRRRTAQTGNGRSSARRRFQNALLPVAPDAELRGISIARPNLGKRLPSFLLVVLLASAIYFAFNAPQLQVAQAQVVGNQMLTSEEINTVLDISGRPAFLLMPSELEKRLRLQFPELAAAKVDVSFAQYRFGSCDRTQACSPLGAGRRLHLDFRRGHCLPPARRYAGADRCGGAFGSAH